MTMGAGSFVSHSLVVCHKPALLYLSPVRLLPMQLKFHTSSLNSGYFSISLDTRAVAMGIAM